MILTTFQEKWWIFIICCKSFFKIQEFTVKICSKLNISFPKLKAFCTLMDIGFWKSMSCDQYICDFRVNKSSSVKWHYKLISFDIIDSHVRFPISYLWGSVSYRVNNQGFRKDLQILGVFCYRINWGWVQTEVHSLRYSIIKLPHNKSVHVVSITSKI